jgi:hypothetical protein
MSVETSTTTNFGFKICLTNRIGRFKEEYIETN